MSEVVKQLNEAERARLAAQTQAIGQAPAPQVDAHSGKQFVFVAHFDGTNNDKDNLPLSGNPQQTNVAELGAQMKPMEAGNRNFYSQYFRGVGTDGGIAGKYSAVVDPTNEMQATAQKAYREFAKEASTWLRAHPEANPADSLQVMATGFSRGGGTAAVFSQLLYERGLTDPDSGKTYVPPGQLGLAGAMIHDPVTTGYNGNSAFSPASKNTTVVRAENEYRTPFKGVDHSGHPGVTTAVVAGNHCNIGGGHDRGIGAQVLVSSTVWLKKAGVPIQDVPPAKRPDGSATVYHERDLPHSDDVAGVSRHPVSRTLFPHASKVAEAAAGAADYPLTHDPRKGLNVARQLDGSAREERQGADGWSRFEGMHGTVWRKDYLSDKGVPLRAVVVERNPPGTANDRVDMVLSRRDGQGEVLLHKTHLPADSGPALRGSLDQRLGAQHPTRADRATGPTADQHALAQHFKEQLGPRLAQLGMSEQQVGTLAAAATKELTRHAGQGQPLAFHLSKDGSTIAMPQARAPLREIDVADALSQSEQAHWQETRAMTAPQPAQTAVAGMGPTSTSAIEAPHSARAMA